MTLIVALEGIDGCGKSTTIRNIAKKLQSLQLRHAVVPYVPDGGIRDAILHDESLDKLSRALLYKVLSRKAWSNIAQLAPQTDIILMDRCDDSFIAYQGAGEQLMEPILRLNDEFSNLQPDVVICLDIPVEESSRRIQERNQQQGVKKDVMEQKSMAFFERTRECYLKLKTHEPQLFIEGQEFYYVARQKNEYPVRYVIDALNHTEAGVLNEVFEILSPLLEKHLSNMTA